MSGDGRIERDRHIEVGDADPEVVYVAAAAHVTVDDRLGAVPVGVAQERPVVAGGVLRAFAWLAVVCATRAQPGAPESSPSAVR